MLTTIKKCSRPIICNETLCCIGKERYMIIDININDLRYHVGYGDVPKNILDKYAHLEPGEKITIDNFSGEDLDNLLLKSYIYWEDGEKECGEFKGIMWDELIKYHETRNSPIELIKYCKYGKYLQCAMLPNIKSTMSCYEVLLLLVNSFMEDPYDCLIKSKIIMAYMLTKYWIWECDFSIVYRDGIMRIFDECIMINLDKDSLNSMSQVFTVEAYDEYGNRIQFNKQVNAQYKPSICSSVMCL